MFNLSGSEVIFLLLLALVVLGPEKLPDAIRKFGRVYAELRKMSTGFQSELRQAMEEPMKELRETAELTRRAATFDPDTPRPKAATPDVGQDDAGPDAGPGGDSGPGPEPGGDPSGPPAGGARDRAGEGGSAGDDGAGAEPPHTERREGDTA